MRDKYNTRAAALYRDKIKTEVDGGSWSAATSEARHWKPPQPVVPDNTGSSDGYMGTGTSRKGVDSAKEEYFAGLQVCVRGLTWPAIESVLLLWFV